MPSLPLSFYQRDTKKVARELLGKKIFRLKNGELTSGLITETEAYLGIEDPACHTYQGRRTERVRSMYLDGGHAYVYFIYGIHFCFNVVTQNEKKPEAVLIRALSPVDGIDIMKKRRNLAEGKALSQLCSGPGKLCQAMAIDRAVDGLELGGPEIWIEEALDYAKIRRQILASPRIGIDYAGEAIGWPLRFSLDIKNI